jgi:hypothetical protein
MNNQLNLIFISFLIILSSSLSLKLTQTCQPKLSNEKNVPDFKDTTELSSLKNAGNVDIKKVKLFAVSLSKLLKTEN